MSKKTTKNIEKAKDKIQREPIYLDLFVDEAFKQAFGTENQSEVVIKGFLNELMKGDPDFGQIKNITFRPNEKVRKRKGDKTIIYDIFCETESHKRYIVEMQQESDRNFLNRARYYIARAIADQGKVKKGDPIWCYEPLYPVVGVFLCDFHINGLNPKTITRVGNMDLDDHVTIGHQTREYYIQFPEFIKEPEECKTRLDQWLYLLKYMPTLEIIPFDIKGDAGLTQLEAISRVSALNDEKKRRYESALRRKRDRLSQLATARWEGRQEGREEGRQEGREEATWKIAQTMKEKGANLATIALYTGLSISELEKGLK